MQVVIDIPENIYNMVMNSGTYGCYRFNSTKAIREGTPLPEGHGRLVDISEYEDNYFNTAIRYDDGNRIHEKYTNVLQTIIEAVKESEGK